MTDPADIPPAPKPASEGLGTGRDRTRQRFEILNRRRTVAALVLARVEEREIARSLGVSVKTVQKDKVAIVARWRESAQRDLIDARGVAAAALDADEVRLRDWMQKAEGRGDLEVAAELYDRILKIHERRSRLLGLDAPEQKEVRFPIAWKEGVLRDEPRPADHVRGVLDVLLGVGALAAGVVAALPAADPEPTLLPEPAGPLPGDDRETRADAPAEADEVHPDDPYGETGRVSVAPLS